MLYFDVHLFQSSMIHLYLLDLHHHHHLRLWQSRAFPRVKYGSFLIAVKMHFLVGFYVYFWVVFWWQIYYRKWVLRHYSVTVYSTGRLGGPVFVILRIGETSFLTELVQVYHPTLKQMPIKMQHFFRCFLRLYSLEFWASKYIPFLGVMFQSWMIHLYVHSYPS